MSGNVKVTEQGVPSYQLDMLESVQLDASNTDILRHLASLSRDGDIITGREPLHPDWIKIYDKNKLSIRRLVPPSVQESIQALFVDLLDRDHLLSQLNPKKLQISFLLGAGASKPSPSNIPTVRELLPQLLERGRRLDRDDVTSLADFCDAREIDNIEDLLTAAQLATFCSRSPLVLRLLNFLLYRSESASAEEGLFDFQHHGPSRARLARSQFGSSADVSSVAFLQDTLQVLFGLLASTMLPARPNRAHEAIAQYAGSRPGSAIVTTNYDCCMDLALLKVEPNYRYGIDFSNIKRSESSADEVTRLVKLHGSLNWYYCETCQEVQLVYIAGLLKHYADDTSPYPVIGICKACGGQRRGLLVPPLAMKFDVAPPLTPLLARVRQAFEDADLIVVLGFSFAEADVYISRMLSKSMQTKTSQKVLVVDPDRDVVGRLRKKFKASIPGFKEERIVRLVGDCSEHLPKFLAGEFLDSGADRRASGGSGGSVAKPRPTKANLRSKKKSAERK